jgi:hypothetical protein
MTITCNGIEYAINHYTLAAIADAVWEGGE